MSDDRDARIKELEVELATARQREAALVSALAEAREQNAVLTAECSERSNQQSATSAVLRVMATSGQDLETVLRVLQQQAGELLGAERGVIHRREGEVTLRVAVPHLEGSADGWVERPLDRLTLAGRTILDGHLHHVHDINDLEQAGELRPEFQALMQRVGAGTYLAVPLLRAGEAIGALHVYRLEVRPFTDREVALLETFADQAVIAIENARLFEELQRCERAACRGIAAQVAVPGEHVPRTAGRRSMRSSGTPRCSRKRPKTWALRHSCRTSYGSTPLASTCWASSTTSWTSRRSRPAGWTCSSSRSSLRRLVRRR